MNQNSIVEFLQWLWTLDGVRTLSINIIVNLVVAIAAAIRMGEFKFHKLGDFLFRKLAPYVLVYGIVKAIAMDTPMAWLAQAAWTILEATLLADLLENAEKLGLRLPASLARLISKLTNFTVDPPA